MTVSFQAVDINGVSVKGGTYPTLWNHDGTVYAVIGVLGWALPFVVLISLVD